MTTEIYSHANQKPGWHCTRADDHDGPCALVPVLFPDRNCWHKWMGPPEICNSPEGCCDGRGWRYQMRTENGQELSTADEVYCECAAGTKRREVE